MNDTIQNIESFLQLTQAQLDTLYRIAPAGVLPEGISDGRALFFPGKPLSRIAAKIAKTIWQGKVFDRKNGTLLNRVVGLQLVKAKVFVDQSWLDEKPAIIIDYQQTSKILPFVRDEIREIAPKNYLGRAYTRTPKGPVFLLNFALQFK